MLLLRINRRSRPIDERALSERVADRTADEVSERQEVRLTGLKAELLAENVRRLQELGCTFSLDDYGTGYSNFTYILELAFDNIKLDRSILWSTATNENARSILRHSIRMIQEIGWKALVEGVETEEQKDMLCDFGCDLLQGFFFSKPVDVETFVAFCKEFNGYMVD